MKPIALLLGFVLSLLSSPIDGLDSPATAGEPAKSSTQIFAIDHAELVRAPYVWKPAGKGLTAHAEATMPGACVKAAFQGSTTVGLVVDGTANRGCPASSMPVVEYSIDDDAFLVVPLARTDATYTLELAKGLNAEKAHRVEIARLLERSSPRGYNQTS
jgi:hypothetical protein